MDSPKTPQEISVLLNATVTAHQQENLQLALDKYLEILKSSPNHQDALHLAGLVYYQAGHNTQAIESYKQLQ